MQLRRVAVMLAGIALAGGWMVASLPAAENKKTKDDIWKDEPKDARRSWSWQRDLSKEQTDKVMKDLQKRDPAKAKALAELRRRDPEQFKTELREQGRPEIEQLIRERWEARRQDRNKRFLEWLKANYPAEEQSLMKLKEGDPHLYMTSFEHMMNCYGYIFEADNSNPDLGTVLKEDLHLRKRTDELCAELHRERSEARKQALGTELQEVVARRYDLIVRRKEIACEQLLKRLEELQRQVTESKDEIAKYKDDRIRRENVKQRLQSLTENKVRFKWD